MRGRLVVFGGCGAVIVALVMCGGGPNHFPLDGGYEYESSYVDTPLIFSDAAAPSDDGAVDAGFDGNDANVLPSDASTDDAADADDGADE